MRHLVSSCSHTMNKLKYRFDHSAVLLNTFVSQLDAQLELGHEIANGMLVSLKEVCKTL